ncbi:MAG: DUF2330 domain-containing protein [Leptospiraceae bacterium]|nr:DUF2330 domain-containing protein [Leptospiraceae bacterium]
MKPNKILIPLIILISALLPYKEIASFCGFYVARADATLYNKASRVILVRDENKTVISMMNDYQGNLKEFAIVVPVPVVLQKDQIHIGDNKVIDHLDAYSAPRLVEYFDPNPCRRKYYKKYSKNEKGAVPSSPAYSPKKKEKKDLGVKVEATYTVGEYDIQILSAKYSDGLETWLNQNGYKIPEGASKALKPYIVSKMKFFVAKVNLEEHSKNNLTYLRPIQFAFESEKFMLPIRLGMINAKGDQDLLVYVLTKNGRVETSNYRTVKLPSNLEVPEYVKGEFNDFYLGMFSNQVKKENGKAVFLEYFWDMSWCDPCAANPLSGKELNSLGVFWVDGNNNTGGAQNVLLTRLHLRYNGETFPEDLSFTQTNDRNNFQGRYIINHPWKGSPNECREASNYFQKLNIRQENRAKNLASLTGWDINDIRKKMNLNNIPNSGDNDTKWWKKIWK